MGTYAGAHEGDAENVAPVEEAESKPAKRICTGGDKDGVYDRRTDKLKQMKEWKSRFGAFMAYTQTVLNDVLGDTRPDATSELNSRPGKSPRAHAWCRSAINTELFANHPEKDPKYTGSNKPPSVTDPKRRVYNSLTEAPRNFKECIDWLIALKGTDPENNFEAMGAALHKFLADKPVGKMELPALEKIKSISKEFLESPGLKNEPFVKRMLSIFNGGISGMSAPAHFADSPDAPSSSGSSGSVSQTIRDILLSNYENIVQRDRLGPEDIAKSFAHVVGVCEKLLDGIKNPDQYNSAYSSEATLDTSCSKHPDACAIIFVGIAPMLAIGFNALFAVDISPLMGLPRFQGCQPMSVRLKAVGYVEPELHAGMNVLTYLMALIQIDKRALVHIYDLAGFWAFY
ncbi:hypothetical protein, conserved [Babesia ovata]|uniref:Uncharacterized protein n=1 Tax=Babesia ovata TaxID=189622 RepID=A0A2H6KH49_9APIC|nr:uncharacterized protein BOVATA_038110 [Babesia ovata]GBE62318.1 hypothetical protein, conserved [Babesia ovata]